MLVSVILPVRDMAASLSAQLEALATQRTSRTFEVIVADHGSSDGLTTVVEAFAGQFEHLVVVDASTSDLATHATWPCDAPISTASADSMGHFDGRVTSTSRGEFSMREFRSSRFHRLE